MQNNIPDRIQNTVVLVRWFSHLRLYLGTSIVGGTSDVELDFATSDTASFNYRQREFAIG